MRPVTYAAVSVAVLVLGIFYRLILHDILFIALGIGRTTQLLGEFPYTCRRLEHPLLESCEDLWMDTEGRTLYAACGEIVSRQGWTPGSVCLFLKSR
jgi:hypothetical protein